MLPGDAGALAAMEDHQLCLRELTDEWTPGRVLHVVGKSVKALGLHDGGHVVLQFLEWPEPLKPYDAVFWVLRRYVADGVAGVAWSVPLEWPPSELVVRGQTHLGEPSFDDLRNAVANVRAPAPSCGSAHPAHPPTPAHSGCAPTPRASSWRGWIRKRRRGQRSGQGRAGR